MNKPKQTPCTIILLPSGARCTNKSASNALNAGVALCGMHRNKLARGEKLTDYAGRTWTWESYSKNAEVMTPSRGDARGEREPGVSDHGAGEMRHVSWSDQRKAQPITVASSPSVRPTQYPPSLQSTAAREAITAREEARRLAQNQQPQEEKQIMHTQLPSRNIDLDAFPDEVRKKLEEADALGHALRFFATLDKAVAARVIDYVVGALGIEVATKNGASALPRKNKKPIVRFVRESGGATAEQIAAHFGVEVESLAQGLRGALNMGMLKLEGTKYVFAGESPGVKSQRERKAAK